jgi:hypothetical protein
MCRPPTTATTGATQTFPTFVLGSAMERRTEKRDLEPRPE